MRTTRPAAERALRTAALFVAGAALAAACRDDAELKDRQGQSGSGADVVTDVENVTIYRNIDDFPNVAVFYVDGCAFFSTSSKDGTRAPAVGRLPEKDEAGCEDPLG